MGYSAEQIGPIEIRDVNTRTKERIALVLIQHGRSPGNDETHVTILSPCNTNRGRTRALELIANGIDINDIRFVEIPSGYAGPGDAAGDGVRLRHCTEAMWWMAKDTRNAETLGMTPAEYARLILDQGRNAAESAAYAARQAAND